MATHAKSFADQLHFWKQVWILNMTKTDGRTTLKGEGESDDGDVHVASLGQGLVVQTGVANDHESWLQESTSCSKMIKYLVQLIERLNLSKLPLKSAL